MKKFFSLVLALVMALSLTTVAWGAGATYYVSSAGDDGAAGTDVAPLKTIEAALAKTGVEKIVLLSDISASNIITIDKAVVIDGTKDASSNWTLTSTAGRAINIDTTGTVEIKNLTVNASGERAFNVINQPATLKLTNVVATAANYTVNVTTSAGAAKVAINNCDLTGLCTVNVWGAGSEVTINGGKITCNDQTDVENYSALNLNSTATGATITATGVTFDIKGDSGLASNATTDGEVLINGSNSGVTTFVASVQYGDYAYLFPTVQDAIDHAVANSQTEVVVLDTAVNSGESFTVPAAGVTVTMPAGAELVDDGTGNMTVAPTGTSAGGFGTMFYESDDAATKNWRLVSSFPGATVADFLVEADYDETIPEGNIEYYDVNGVAYVEATKATGAYKLVCGKTEVFLNLAADVDYEFEAEAFYGITTDEDACGSVLVTKKNLTKTYYTATCEVGKVEYTFYFVADKNGGTDLLVGNKIVKADLIGDDFSGGAGNAFIAHDWAGNDVDAKTKAFTTLKCENCGKVAKLYANADAAGKGAVYEQYGWITAADAGYDVVVPTTPSTDKVQSAETFDAGIAMYVGMSVMAAAGSAVVIGKKKD